MAGGISVGFLKWAAGGRTKVDATSTSNCLEGRGVNPDVLEFYKLSESPPM
jgi:hypothetical protein